MTKVGFITTPLSSAHAVRGVGFYTKHLLGYLKPLAPEFRFEILEINSLGQLDQLGQLEIIHYPFFDLFRRTLRTFLDIKTVVTIHDVIPLEFPDHYPPGLKGWLNLRLQRLALSEVEGVITDSYASVQSIHKHLNVPHEKIKLIYLAANPILKKINKPANKYKLPKKFVLYVGDINYNKNIPNLITACRIIDTPLVMIGKQAGEVVKLDLSHPELSHLRGLDWSTVTRLGFVPDADLVNIYNLATVYCQPSFAEGSALTILEALACGTLVTCSDIPVFHEHAGEAATYFDPYNIDTMAKALQNPHASFQTTKFTWEQTARQTLSVYQELL